MSGSELSPVALLQLWVLRLSGADQHFMGPQLLVSLIKHEGLPVDSSVAQKSKIYKSCILHSMEPSSAVLPLTFSQQQ